MTATTTAPPGAGNAPKKDPTKKLIDNERIKISATLLNNCAMAALGTGVIVPTAAIAYGTTNPTSPYYLWVAAGWFASGIGLHLFTRWTLRKLEA